MLRQLPIEGLPCLGENQSALKNCAGAWLKFSGGKTPFRKTKLTIFFPPPKKILLANFANNWLTINVRGLLRTV